MSLIWDQLFLDSRSQVSIRSPLQVALFDSQGCVELIRWPINTHPVSFTPRGPCIDKRPEEKKPTKTQKKTTKIEIDSTNFLLAALFLTLLAFVHEFGGLFPFLTLIEVSWLTDWEINPHTHTQIYNQTLTGPYTSVPTLRAHTRTPV